MSWTEDAHLAADALEVAAGYIERAAREGAEFGASARTLMLLEQSRGEIERAGQFMQRAWVAVERA